MLVCCLPVLYISQLQEAFFSPPSPPLSFTWSVTHRVLFRNQLVNYDVNILNPILFTVLLRAEAQGLVWRQLRHRWPFSAAGKVKWRLNPCYSCLKQWCDTWIILYRWSISCREVTLRMSPLSTATVWSADCQLAALFSYLASWCQSHWAAVQCPNTSFPPRYLALKRAFVIFCEGQTKCHCWPFSSFVTT